MERAETWKHCRKLCFDIYWKGNCKIFLLDPVYYNAGSSNLQSKLRREKQRICTLLSGGTQTGIEWQNLGTQSKERSVVGGGLSPQ